MPTPLENTLYIDNITSSPTMTSMANLLHVAHEPSACFLIEKVSAGFLVLLRNRLISLVIAAHYLTVFCPTIFSDWGWCNI